MPVPELDRQRERGQRRDAAQANQPLDDVDVRWRGGELSDRLIERVASAFRVKHPPVTLVEDNCERPAVEPLPAKPGVVRPRPRRPHPSLPGLAALAYRPISGGMASIIRRQLSPGPVHGDAPRGCYLSLNRRGASQSQCRRASHLRRTTVTTHPKAMCGSGGGPPRPARRGSPTALRGCRGWPFAPYAVRLPVRSGSSSRHEPVAGQQSLSRCFGFRSVRASPSTRRTARARISSSVRSTSGTQTGFCGSRSTATTRSRARAFSRSTRC